MELPRVLLRSFQIQIWKSYLIERVAKTFKSLAASDKFARTRTRWGEWKWNARHIRAAHTP